ncbi:MAG TPA: RNA polymerase sigma factor RpoD/SigA [Candidatus Polarisedimenticolaceae bacterium]|nr:RNA polymerase sigma factor RpoD/SigA [Candidatus Polarisedimenticolaceae bacterium]
MLREHSATLGSYLQAVRDRPLLTREEELGLARTSRAGNRNARDRLIQSNLAFVVKVAKQYRGLGVPFEDLINEGNVGLVEAARRFDPTRGTRFVTCAVWWIRKAILGAIDERAALVPVPVYQRRHGGSDRARVVELDAPSGAERETRRVEPLRAPEESAEQALIERESRDLLDTALAGLGERERAVLSLRFGLDGNRPHVLEELGARLGVSRERVRQIEAQALRRLKRFLMRAA